MPIWLITGLTTGLCTFVVAMLVRHFANKQIFTLAARLEEERTAHTEKKQKYIDLVEHSSGLLDDYKRLRKIDEARQNHIVCLENLVEALKHANALFKNEREASDRAHITRDALVKKLEELVEYQDKMLADKDARLRALAGLTPVKTNPDRIKN
jgi:hypothetical protein